MYQIPARNSLHFPWAKVSKALDEVRGASNVRTLYGEETGPGLWLVSDEGIYLMPNSATSPRTIVYARECDPGKLPFDSWWGNKRALGGGDSIEFIALSEIDQMVASLRHAIKTPRHLFININSEGYAFGIL